MRRILVASDEASARSDTTHALLSAGFDVVGQASTRSQTASLALQLDPDLIVLDSTIGHSDAAEHVAEPARSVGIETSTPAKSAHLFPIVMLAAPGQAGTADFPDAVVLAVVTKPVYFTRLVPAVEIALARGADIRALHTRRAQASKRLADHKKVERAKGLLMKGRAMTEAESMRWLQDTAAELRLPLGDVADSVRTQFSGAG
jgi:response regulator NasT